MSSFKSQLKNIYESGYYRNRIILNSKQDRYIQVGKKKLLSFASNDYLGMATNKGVIDELKKSASMYGVGSASSPLITGYSKSHHYLEKEICEYLNTESCIVVNSGYMANICLLNIFDNKDVYQDKESHNSIIESSKINKLKIHRYRHLDNDHLIELLKKSDSKNKIIFSESVFSMSGEISNLKEHLKIKRKHKTYLFIDDAHGLAVSNRDNIDCKIENTCSLFNIKPSSIDAYVGTFGKAVGTTGAFICGNKDLIDMIIQRGKPYIYSTALPRCIIDATRRSLQYLSKDKTRLVKLHENIKYINDQCARKKLKIIATQSPIKTFLIGDPTRTIKVRDALLSEGIIVQAIRYPTVPLNTDRLRVTITSNHKKKDIDKLLNSLENISYE